MPDYGLVFYQAAESMMVGRSTMRSHFTLPSIRSMKTDRSEVPRRIVYCSTALSPGGELTWLERTISTLDRSKFTPLICSVRKPKAGSEALSQLGAEVTSLGVGRNYDIVRATRRLSRYLRDVDADLIHMSLFGTEIVPFLASMLTKIPLVATVTTTMDPRTVSAASRSRKMLWTLRTARLVQSALARLTKTEFLVLSEELRRSTRKHLGAGDDRITTVNVGLDPARFVSGRPQAMEQGADTRSPVLVCVGRLSEAKDQQVAIRAMVTVLERLPNAQLMIVGEGPLRSKLQLLIKQLGLENNVLLLGHRGDVPELLQAGDAFLFTSNYEGQPHSVVEAMASGKPVVALKIPATAELIEDGVSGILVEGRDPVSLGTAIVEVLSDPQRAFEMGVMGRKIVEERFDAGKNTRQIEKLYERLAS